MPFPTLSDSELAAKSVAQGIHNETISLDSVLDTKSSNAIVRELLKLDENNFKKLEVFKNQLSVTEIYFPSCKIDAEAVRNLSNFNLVSLDLGEIIEYSGDPWGVETLDIVNLLMQSTNDHSRRSMIHLGLPTEQEFIEGWEAEVRSFGEESVHSEFFKGFRNAPKPPKHRYQLQNIRQPIPIFQFLLLLPESSCSRLIRRIWSIKSPRNQKSLKNLQKLTMKDVKFNDTNEYEELSELKNLKYFLDVSNTNDITDMREERDWEETNPIRDMLAAGVRMEALEFLDCSWTSVTGNELETFAKNHPSLKTVVAICTACNQTTISGVKMLNIASMPLLSECFEYTLLTDRFDLTFGFIPEVFEKLKTCRENLTNAELRHITNAVLFVLRESFFEGLKFMILLYYLESGLFEHELSISLFSADIPDMIELFYNVFNKHSPTSFKKQAAGFIFRMLEATVNAVRPGILIPDRVSKFVLEKTLDLVDQFPEHRTQAIRIIRQTLAWMTLEQLLKMSLNFELAIKVMVFLNSPFVF